MRVASFTEYGTPKDVLSIVEKQKPQPGKGEVLIKVHATTINDYDWSLVRGKPFI
jgi:NADPH:quinone reductase-like Zn-dependent oxidoreductase